MSAAMTTKSSRRPFGLSWRSHTGFILSSVFLGLFSDIFLYCLFVPILPYLLEDHAGIPPSDVQVHVSGMLAAYAGASVIFSPIAGWIADRTVSRQMPFLCGLTALMAGTVLLYAAPNEPLMILARVLQGVSSAVVWSVGLAMCMDTVGPDNLGKTIGLALSIASFGGLAGPPLGGAFYQAGGYEGVFGAAVAVLVLDFGMRLFVIEKRTAAQYLPADEDPQPPSFSRGGGTDAPPDAAGGNAVEECADDESWPLLQAHDSEYKIPTERPRLLQALPLLYCFTSPAFLATQFLALQQSSILGAFDATVPVTAQAYFGFTPLTAGLLFVPLAVIDLVVGPLAGWLVDRRGTKPAAVLGCAILAPALACLRFVRPGGADAIALYCGLLAACGAGVSAMGAPCMVEATRVVARYHGANPEAFGPRGPYAQLYGLNSMVFNLGLAVGPLVFGPLRTAVGYGNMNAVAAGMCVIGGVLSFAYIGGRPEAQARKTIRRVR